MSSAKRLSPSRPARLALVISIGSVVAVLGGTLPIVTSIQTSAAERGRLEQQVLENRHAIMQLKDDKVNKETFMATMFGLEREMKRMADELAKLNERDGRR